MIPGSQDFILNRYGKILNMAREGGKTIPGSAGSEFTFSNILLLFVRRR